MVMVIVAIVSYITLIIYSISYIMDKKKQKQGNISQLPTITQQNREYLLQEPIKIKKGKIHKPKKAESIKETNLW